VAAAVSIAVPLGLGSAVFDRWQQQRQQLGLPIFDPTKIYHGRGVPDDQIGITVDCSTVADRVVAGLLEHRSQLHVMADDPIEIARMRHIVSREWMVIAWPPGPTPTVMLTDIFDGLN
jgi:hypothetical protein